MLTMTESAGARLAELLDEAEAPGGAAARFVAGPEGLSLAMDARREGDQTFDHEGRTVLVLAADVADALSDKMLDTEETDHGLALTLQPTEDADS